MCRLHSKLQIEMNFKRKISQIKSKCNRAFRLSFGTLPVCLMQQCFCPAVEQDTFSRSLSPVCSAKLMLSDHSPCHRLPIAQSPAILMTHPTLIRPQTTLHVWVLFPGPAVEVTCPPLPWSSQTRPSVCGGGDHGMDGCERSLSAYIYPAPGIWSPPASSGQVCQLFMSAACCLFCLNFPFDIMK